MFLFLFCAACLPASLIMHVPISGLLAQWHRCLHCRMNLHSKRFLQFHPKVMMVVYFNSCLFFLAESVKILIRPRAGFPLADIFPQQTSCMHKGHMNRWVYRRTHMNLCPRCILNRYIMFGRGICENYQSRDEQSQDWYVSQIPLQIWYICLITPNNYTEY